MHFLQPLGLLGLAAIIPIVALYFLKLRREKNIVPSTLLWKKVIEDMHVNAPFQRLKYSLLLMMQLILIALLAFALARPFLSMPGAQSKRIVLLIDTSASMATQDAGKKGDLTRLEAAIQDAQAKIDDLGIGGEMRIVAFDEETRQLSRFTSDKRFLRDKLKALEPRHLGTNAQSAFETALSLAEERPNTEVVVLSDGSFDKLSLQRLLGNSVEGQNTEEASLTRLRKFRFKSYGKIETDNVGITNINTRTRTVQALDADGVRQEAMETQVFVMVENFSSENKDVILSLATDSQQFTPKVVKLKARPRGGVTLSEDPEKGHTLEASRSQEVFRLPLNSTGVVTASITAPKDSFSLDNQAMAVVGHTENLKVLLVTKGNYFIQRTFMVLKNVETETMKPDDFLEAWKARGARCVEEFDAVVFEGVAPPSWEDGGALFINAMPPLSGFVNQKDQKPREGPLIIDWDNVHPVMRYVNFGNVQVLRAQNWKVPKTTTTLVEASGGPLVLGYETDRVHVVATAFDIFKSDWALRPSLPLFLRNTVAWVSEVSPKRRAAMVRTGDPLVIPPILNARSATLVMPTGKSLEIPLSQDRKQFVKGINHVGLYRLTGLPGSKEESEIVYAVNLADPHESDNLAEKKVMVGEAPIEESSNVITARREFWRTLVLIAGALLLLEWWVYHRRMGI